MASGHILFESHHAAPARGFFTLGVFCAYFAKFLYCTLSSFLAFRARIVHATGRSSAEFLDSLSESSESDLPWVDQVVTRVPCGLCEQDSGSLSLLH